jgi:hypothetical protein
MAADGRRALNGKADRDRILGLGRNVDVLASDVRAAVVVEWEQVDLG